MQHIVKFDVWCPKCKHEKLDGNVEPCDTCLGYGTAEDSRKPVCWTAKKNGGKKG